MEIYFSPYCGPRPRSHSIAPLLLAAALSAAGFGGCSANEDAGFPIDERGESVEIDGAARESANLSPDAKPSTHEMLWADMQLERGPADGGGSARIVGPGGDEGHDAERLRFPVGSRQRIEIIFEAGPHGIALGGAVYLQVPPFWDWDPPQLRYPEAPGYTEVESLAGGVVLEPREAYDQPLMIGIAGRALEAGERIRIVYGAGAAGARVDSYAEDESRLFISVDGDGDGVRGLIDDSPSVDIEAGPPVRVWATLPSTARPGESVRLTVAALDGRANLSKSARGTLSFVSPPAGLVLPEQVILGAELAGRTEIEVRVKAPGVYRLSLRGTGEWEGFSAETNPLVVRDALAPVLWADVHGHSHLSDGTGTPEQYFDYARNVAGLDVSALTDHDHWGMRFLDATPSMWNRIRQSVERFHEPGRFVALLGYEWTSWLHGHRHVLYFGNGGEAEGGQEEEVLSSMDPVFETPVDLWRGLEGKAALTFAHHSAGGPIGTNWRYPPDPILEPVTEITSVHGSSEALDSPGAIYNPVPGNFVRDVLMHGYALGFIGSGDGHDGHPGLTHLANPPYQGGLAAIRSESHTRAGVLAALRARRVYATNGARIFLHVGLEHAGTTYGMGARLPATAAATTGELASGERASQRLTVDVVGTAPIERIDIVRSGSLSSIPGEGRSEFIHTREIPALMPGEFHYVRVVQVDGGAAWSSPIFAPHPARDDTAEEAPAPR